MPGDASSLPNVQPSAFGQEQKEDPKANEEKLELISFSHRLIRENRTHSQYQAIGNKLRPEIFNSSPEAVLRTKIFLRNRSFRC